MPEVWHDVHEQAELSVYYHCGHPLSFGDLKGLPPTFEGCRIDEEENDEIELREEGCEIGTRLFDTDGKRAVREVIAHLIEPIAKRGRLSGDAFVSGLVTIGMKDGGIDVPIRTIDANKSSVWRGVGSHLK